jgi:hypothetical protein
MTGGKRRMSDNTEYVRIAHACYSKDEWERLNPKLYLGEIGIESDTGNFKIGDGNSTWIDLTYWHDKVGLNQILRPSTGSVVAMVPDPSGVPTPAFNITKEGNGYELYAGGAKIAKESWVNTQLTDNATKTWVNAQLTDKATQTWVQDNTKRYCHNILLMDPKGSGTNYVRVNFFFINNAPISYSNGLTDSSTKDEWETAFYKLVEVAKTGIATHGFYKVGDNYTLPFRIKEKKTVDDNNNKTFVF